MRRPPRPRGQVCMYQARHGAWIVDLRYPGSGIRDVLEMKVGKREAEAAYAFFSLIEADDALFALRDEGAEIAHAHFRAGWFTEGGEER